MKTLSSLPFLAAFLAVQGSAPPAAPRQEPPASGQSSSVPLYRVVVVQGSAKAINYRDLKSTTKIDLKGTALCPGASGRASVETEHGGIEIEVKVKDLPAASTFGGEFLTYVLWGISTEGRATNLGELPLEHGKAKLEAKESLQTFGLVVTAEPYFAVSQPSDVVVLENAVDKDTQGHVELIDAKYELLKRGQYAMNGTRVEPLAMDKGTPFEVYQARNAVRIAQDAGAAAYAPDPLNKAEAYLARAEAGTNGKKDRIQMARESIQRAEDARQISVEKQRTNQAAMEKTWAQDKLDAANRDTAAATAGQDAALAQSSQTTRENEDLRSRNEGLTSRNEGLATRNEGLASANEGLVSKNEGLRAELLTQLNAVLETRATARGLIVNMSGVLFQNGKAALVPAAREKLAKIAGILSAHKGLVVEADGFTDSNGSDAFNQHLSEARAETAKDYLVSQGVPAASVSFKGFGKDGPIASNATSEGRRQNRRVELVVSGEGITAPETGGL